MKVKCIYNTGEILMSYERKQHGVSKNTTYGQLEIGKEYLVMGMILKNGFLKYLVDDYVISACPYQLFDITDNSLPSHWYFRAFTKDDDNYISQEAVWGYYELCFDDRHYEQLVEMDESAHRLYFRRKIELEKELSERDNG